MRRLPFILGNRRINFLNGGMVGSGLGARLIPMGCTLRLAAELNPRPRPVIVWVPDGAVSGASFGDLFETANLPFELMEGFEGRIMKYLLGGAPPGRSPLIRMGFKLYRRLVLGPLGPYRKRTYRAIRKEGYRIREKAALSLDPRRGYVVSTFGYFRYGCDLDWLKPGTQLVSRIIELKKRFAPDTVGVHLRGTELIKNPPIDKMIARMRAEVELNPEVKFFFASDGDKKGEAIETLFEDRLIKSPKGAPRMTVEGQQDAVVDLFGLAATSRIIGIRQSSFATVAALIGNKPLLRIKPT